MFIVLAAFCYAINANVLKYKLPNIPALGIVFMSFLFMFIPAFIVLCFSNFPFSDFTSDPLIMESFIYIIILARLSCILPNPILDNGYVTSSKMNDLGAILSRTCLFMLLMWV